jgi:hypothetical protein
MTTKVKSIYISKSDIKVCSCGTVRKDGEIIYSLKCYEKKSLKQFASICSECIKWLSVQGILANSPLIYITYEKNPVLPSFLERKENGTA